MRTRTIVCWFRQDLRLADNPALFEASRQGRVIPVFIQDDASPGRHQVGAAGRWWIHHSLIALDRSLHGSLNLYRGDPFRILREIVGRHDAGAVFWNRCYEPWRISRDTRIREELLARGIEVRSFNGSLLKEPWENLKEDGTPYRVFTRFYRKGYDDSSSLRAVLPAPQPLNAIVDPVGNVSVESLGLLPGLRWDHKLEPHWQIGEQAALAKLRAFASGGYRGYRKGRDFPAQPHVSRLSPHLHAGELSPNQVWAAIDTEADDPDRAHFRSEVGWREFSYYLLFHFPVLPDRNLQPRFDEFPWGDDPGMLQAWRRGRTGIPLVDAGMRELWNTGYMHNRVRMVVGSFLVKNLLCDWRLGERWFRDCLVDADLASNAAGWQWVAGCGADAAPYFRIFNPVTQGQKFDPDGSYTRLHVPELARLPDRYLFNPWEAPADVLARAGIELGRTYPRPLVDLRVSRQRALDAFSSLGKRPEPENSLNEVASPV